MIRWPSNLSLAGFRQTQFDNNVGRVTARTTPPQIDFELITYAAILMLLGMVMVYSATIALPDSARFAAYKPWHFLLRHVIAIGVGVAAGAVAFTVPIEVWRRWSGPLFLLGLLLLLIVLIPGIGKSVYGARRWIPLGFFNLQPSELMKIAVILYAADFIVRKQASMHRFRKGFLPLASAMAVVGGLLLLEPDLGAYVVMVMVALGLLFIGGISLVWFFGLGSTLCVVFGLIVWLSPWRRARMFAYLDPFDENNVLGKGYQLAQSLMAFGRGELTGVGLGGSVGKLHYLPEAHTDFLLAVIGEELGLVGVAVVIFLFYKITRKAFEIGRQAVVVQSPFAGMVAMGIGIWIGVQAFFNMGVNLGLLPTKGLTLPLMSYGGSAILFSCIGLAILLRIDFENKRLMRGSAP
jgi:cell division protein FtsW